MEEEACSLSTSTSLTLRHSREKRVRTRTPLLLTVALASVALPRCLADAPPWQLLPDSTLSLSQAGTSDPPPFFAESSYFGSAPSGAPYVAFLAPDTLHLGCDAMLPPVPATPPSMYVLARGNCTFYAKAMAAQKAGASALVVYDSLASAYLSTDGSGTLNASLVASRCTYDCGAGSTTIAATDVTPAAALAGYPSKCGDALACPSQLCMLMEAPPDAGSGGSRQACCAVAPLLSMTASDHADDIRIESAYVDVATGVALAAALTATSAAAGGAGSSSGVPVLLTLSLRPVPTMDPSGMLLIALGTLAAGFAAYYSAWPERLAIAQLLRAVGKNGVRRGSGPPVGSLAAGQPEPIQLTARGAVVALCAAALLLGGLFVLIRLGVRIVYIILAVFFLGASSALASVVLRPLISALWPGSESCVVLKCGDTVVTRRRSIRETAELLGGATIVGGGGGDPSVSALPPTLVIPPTLEERERALASIAAGDGGASSAPSASAVSASSSSTSAALTAQQRLSQARAAALPLQQQQEQLSHSVAVHARPPRDSRSGGSNSRRRESLLSAEEIDETNSGSSGNNAPRSPPPQLQLTAAALVSTLGGLTVASLFLATRHATWSWILQDALGVCLCASFLLAIRVHSLRTAALTLVMFFVYDVFMVFITPYIFGSSIMVDVATAGGPSVYDGADGPACHCRYNLDDSDVCGPVEYMPILLRLPRMADYRGGYSMLGLGDIVVPGLALAMALRQDYYGAYASRSAAARATAAAAGASNGHSLSASAAADGGYANTAQKSSWLSSCRGLLSLHYFIVAMAGYLIGLSAANAAVAYMKMGQPALLYLVPCILAPLMLLAWRKGELKAWWEATDPGAASAADASGGGGGGDAPYASMDENEGMLQHVDGRE